VADLDITDEEYKRAESIFNSFKCKSFRDYCRIYIKAITLLNSDVFLKFISFSMKNFGLSPAHSTSLPGFVYDACMFSIKKPFELISDDSILKFLAESIRGGPSFSTTRFAASNSERLRNYNPVQTRKEIIFIDLNSLYPHCLSQYQGIADYQ